MHHPVRIVVVTALAIAAVALGVALQPSAASAATPATPALAAVASTTGLASTGGPATGLSATSSTGSSDASALSTLCHLAKTTDARLRHRVTRDEASATTKGSIAWLTARATKARQAGHTAAAERLTKRATARTQRLATLKDREQHLAAAIKAECPAG